MNLAALSLEQAPPLSVPMRFFLTAPLFGAAAPVLLFIGKSGGETPLASRWSPALLAATHLVLLGFVVSVMFGAMQQMLPVVAGAPIARPRLLSAVVHLGWTLGVIALGAGLWALVPSWMVVAAALLVAAALSFIGAAGYSLWRAPAGTETVTAMRLSLLSFAVAAGLGATLAAGYGGLAPLWRVPLTNIHLLWALVGWIGLLIIGVSYQVVPMFQMTPPYPRRVRQLLAPALFALLVLRTAAGLVGYAPAAVALELAIAAALLVFAGATLHVQSQRRRKLPDPTFGFFRLGVAGLAVAAVLHALGALSIIAGDGPAIGAGIAYVFGFAVPIVLGMLYKIVPFLVWLHLQGENTRRMKEGRPLLALPNMKDAIPERLARAQLHSYLLAVALLAAIPLAPALLTRLGALALLATFAILEWSMVSGWATFRRHRRLL